MSEQNNLQFAILATDTCLFAYDGKQLLVRLIKVDRPPHFIDMHGLPGGLISPDETADQAAQRHLKEKGGITNTYIEQLYTFSDIERDPRGRVVAVGYLALSHLQTLNEQSVSEEYSPEWMPVQDVSQLAYDHDKILQVALERLRSKLEYTNIAFALLPEKFTLTELQSLYEVILNRELDKRNFRKKILSLNMLKDTGKKDYSSSKRPAQLYEFRKKSLNTFDII